MTRSQERVPARQHPAPTVVRQWLQLVPVLTGAALLALAAGGCGGESPAHAVGHDGVAHHHDGVAHSHDAGAHSHEGGAHHHDGVMHSHDGVAHSHDGGEHEHDLDLPPAGEGPERALEHTEHDLDNAERDLYFTPGGCYTDADIAANGPVPPAQKYARIPANHSLKSRPGDRICPVTLTRVNPKFSWVIGGKTYLFCCPPCIDDFVRAAKERPNEIQAPAAYVKR